jgi:Domain of unknown function (DUF4432)
MTSHVVSINLPSDTVMEASPVLASCGDLTASTFRFGTGVLALRIANEVGWIDLLPYQGQQIWDAQFYGRRLTMNSIFSEPQLQPDYLESYGAFLIHCGATAMGRPSPGDTHPLHGELPNARYQSPRLQVGSDDLGTYMSLTGTYHHRVAFNHHYRAQPTVTLRSASGRLSVDMTIQNLRRSPMDLMYMMHINFLPVDDAELADSVSGAGPVRRAVRDYGRTVDPELVFDLDGGANTEGWSHAVQLHPDGSADFVSHRPDELDHALRWLVRNGDEEALGLSLPATAQAEGYAAEKAKGHVKCLYPDARFHCTVELGALTSADAEKLLESMA